MRFGWIALLALAFSLAPASSHASEVHLLAHTLAWDGHFAADAGVSLGGRHDLRLDDGSGGGSAGSYLLEGCTSLLTEGLASLAGAGLATYLVAAGLVVDASERDPTLSATQAAIVATNVILFATVLVTPFLTSALVYLIARGDGEVSYWKIVAYSIAARLLTGLPAYFTHNPTITFVSLIAGAIAEVYAANSGPHVLGSGGDVVAQSTERTLTARGLVTRRMAAGLPVSLDAELLSVRF